MNPGDVDSLCTEAWRTSPLRVNATRILFRDDAMAINHCAHASAMIHFAGGILFGDRAEL